MTAPRPAPPPSMAKTPNPYDADELLHQLADEYQEREFKDEQSDDDFYQYVQWCRRGHVALFYRVNPLRLGSVTPKDWFSVYKKIDEPWRGVVTCQVCTDYANAATLSSQDNFDEFPIQADYQPAPRNTVIFMPQRRWVYRYPKDASKRKEIRPHRAAMLQETAGNYGVPNPDFPLSFRELTELEKAKELQKREQLLQGLGRKVL